MAPVLRIRDEYGSWIPITALKGDKGDKGDPGEVSRDELHDALSTKADRPYVIAEVTKAVGEARAELTDQLSAKADRSYVAQEVARVVDGAPEAFDTLREIADELEQNTSERAALTNQIATKAPTSLVESRPAMWLWSGTGTWTPPPGAVVTDNVLNLKSGEIHALRNV